MGVACEIIINKTREGVFRAGRPVSGVVKYAIDEPTNYCDVILSLVGEGRCSWTKTEYIGKEKRTVTYTGTENYFTRQLNMLNKRPGETITLPFGAYEFPFEFILPKNIPPSFSDITSTISYQVRVLFARPGLFQRNRKFHVDIPVYGYVEHPYPDSPIVFAVDKELFKPFSDKKHQVRLKGQILRACLSPGQNANLSFVVNNESDVDVTSIKTELICNTTYRSNCGRENHKCAKISSFETVSVPRHTVAELCSVVPILPELYSIQFARIITKSYVVKVTIRLPIPHINATVEQPIVIGEREDLEGSIEVLRERDETDCVDALDEPPSYWEEMGEKKK